MATSSSERAELASCWRRRQNIVFVMIEACMAACSCAPTLFKSYVLAAMKAVAAIATNGDGMLNNSPKIIPIRNGIRRAPSLKPSRAYYGGVACINRSINVDVKFNICIGEVAVANIRACRQIARKRASRIALLVFLGLFTRHLTSSYQCRIDVKAAFKCARRTHLVAEVAADIGRPRRGCAFCGGVGRHREMHLKRVTR